MINIFCDGLNTAVVVAPSLPLRLLSTAVLRLLFLGLGVVGTVRPFMTSVGGVVGR